MRENSTGVLSSSMASDTAIINGVGGESLGPQIEAFLSLASGLVIGFYYCWQESLVMLGITPVLAIGSVLEMQF